MIKILLYCLKNSFHDAFFKESTKSLCLTGKDKLFYALQVVTVKVLPPSVSRLKYSRAIISVELAVLS